MVDCSYTYIYCRRDIYMYNQLKAWAFRNSDNNLYPYKCHRKQGRIWNPLGDDDFSGGKSWYYK